jgi:hypothetical protein
MRVIRAVGAAQGMDDHHALVGRGYTTVFPFIFPLKQKSGFLEVPFNRTLPCHILPTNKKESTIKTIPNVGYP